jgi:DNA repair protein RadA/Sms
MSKGSNTIFLCQSCGFESRKWLGKCPECGEWNSLVEERVVTDQKGFCERRVSFTRSQGHCV